MRIYKIKILKIMKHVKESLKEYNDYKFFKLFEEEKAGTDKETLKSKEQDGLAIIDKITSNFEDFKKSAKGEVLKYKEFWEENKSIRRLFASEPGDIYKLHDSDYAVGVLQLPVKTLSDGSIEGGLGASDEPQEEIIEGKEITQDEPSPDDVQPVMEAEETEDPAANLDFGGDGEVAPEEAPAEEAPVEEPAVAPEETPEEPQANLTSPGEYLVVYDLSGDGEREEIFRCGSNNVVKAFNAFYNDVFKGSMKDIIAKYKEQKEAEKVDAEKSEKKKVETEKQNKVKKFLGEDLNEDIDLSQSNLSNEESEKSDDFDSWLDEVTQYLIDDYELAEDDADIFTEIAEEQLQSLFDGGSSAFDAAGIIASDEEIWEELKERVSDESKEFETSEDESEDEDEDVVEIGNGDSPADYGEDDEDKFQALKDEDDEEDEGEFESPDEDLENEDRFELSDENEDEEIEGEEEALEDLENEDEEEYSEEELFKDNPDRKFRKKSLRAKELAYESLNEDELDDENLEDEDLEDLEDDELPIDNDAKFSAMNDIRQDLENQNEYLPSGEKKGLIGFKHNLDYQTE
jgi:hypothetical protein